MRILLSTRVHGPSWRVLMYYRYHSIAIDNTVVIVMKPMMKPRPTNHETARARTRSPVLKQSVHTAAVWRCKFSNFGLNAPCTTQHMQRSSACSARSARSRSRRWLGGCVAGLARRERSRFSLDAHGVVRHDALTWARGMQGRGFVVRLPWSRA